MTTQAVTEADLHAWVDGLLPEARRAEIEVYLQARPEEAERLAAYRAQNEALRGLFGPVADERLPDSLQRLLVPPAMLAVDRPKRPIFSPWSLQRLAAGILIALVSGVAGWLAHGQYSSVDRLAQTSLPRQAAVAHVVFTPDVRRPVEVRAEQEEQLVAWLSKRLAVPVRPPKLAGLGYELVGGRLLPGSSGPVAQFMYQEASGQRLTLYVSTEMAGQSETGFRFAREGQINVFYWIDGQFGYALSAGMDKGELARIATAVYEQLERK